MSEPRLAAAIKDRLRAGNVTTGAWLSLPHVSVGEIVAGAGFDWVVVDTEHTAVDVSEVLPMILAIERRGAVALVRLASNDPVQCKSVMDSGAAGVIVPMVNTRAEAELAVASVKYPPQGIRGVGLARAHGYGPGFDSYMEAANRDSLVIVQIEHIEGVNNIEEIVSVPGLDGTFIGPYDLSASLGLAGQLEHPEVVAARQRVLEATRSRGLASGVHVVHPATAEQEMRRRIAEGYQFIALSSDMLLLGHAHRELAAMARRMQP
ncbi:MAG: hypothetical protein AMXMBFR57_16650 [Acidimicrobiia bacterium]